MSRQWVKGVPVGDQAREQARRREAAVTLSDPGAGEDDGLAPANPDQVLDLQPADEPAQPGDFRARQLPDGNDGR